jgi:hypothetical protein
MGKWGNGDATPGRLYSEEKKQLQTRLRFRGIPGESTQKVRPISTRKPSTRATRQRGEDEDKRREEEIKTKKKRKMRDERGSERSGKQETGKAHEKTLGTRMLGIYSR